MDGSAITAPDIEWFAAFSALRKGSFMRPTATQRVYCITEGAGLPIKVGVSRNLQTRFSQIQTNTWRQVYLCWSARGGFAHENALKHILKGEAHLGEWVNDPTDELKRLLKHNSAEAALIAGIQALAAARGIGPQARPPERRRGPRTIQHFIHGVA